jgi:predicted O-methyltransferase YrrM
MTNSHPTTQDGQSPQVHDEAEQLMHFVKLAESIPGWRHGEEAKSVARASFALGPDAVIVEIGVFLGRSTVLLAGARQLHESGMVHCVDPFDCSGDAFSVPHYQNILESVGGGRLREHFETNIARAGLLDRVKVHEGSATDIAKTWTQPIDLLLLDGDQSPEGARRAYEAWEPFLMPGGTIVLGNSGQRDYAEGHDGNRQLALKEIVPSKYTEIQRVGDVTIARKRASEQHDSSPVSADASAPATRLAAAETRLADAQDLIANLRQRLHAESKERRRLTSFLYDRSKWPVLRRAPQIHLFALCWNDEFALPFFFRHYDEFVDRYVIFDDGSTDRSLQTLHEHPKVEVREFIRSDPDSFVLSEQSLSNACWKESRGTADWVIVTDVDEHLYHPRMRDYLAACTRAGVTLVPALGFQMICEQPPSSENLLLNAAPFGSPWEDMTKLSVFRPSEIDEINFSIGRHTAAPSGEIRLPMQDEVLLLHYKYLGFERTYSRHRELATRLGQKDINNDWGKQYSFSREDLAKHWNSFSGEIIDVRDALPQFYPITKWWRRPDHIGRFRQTRPKHLPPAEMYLVTTHMTIVALEHKSHLVQVPLREANKSELVRIHNAGTGLIRQGPLAGFTVEICREGLGFPHLHLCKDGKYLCAEPDGTLVVNRDAASDWESFFAVSEKEIVNLPAFTEGAAHKSNAMSPTVVAFDLGYQLP